MLDLSLSPETKAIYDALVAVPIGGEITYSALSAIIGRPADKAGRSSLESARRIALRDNGVAFSVVRKVGLRRLRPEEAADIGRGKRKKIRRAAHSAVFAMTRVAETSNGLPPESQRRLSAEIAAHGLISLISTDAAVAPLEAEKAMPPARAGRAFLEHIGALRPDDEQN